MSWGSSWGRSWGASWGDLAKRRGGAAQLHKRIRQFEDKESDVLKAQTRDDIEKAIAQVRTPATPTLVTPAISVSDINARPITEYFDGPVLSSAPKSSPPAAAPDITVDVNALLWAANDDIALGLLM